MTKSTWLEQGPRPVVVGRQGLGDAPSTPDDVVTVNACAPDICFNLGFPWVGRRTELTPGQTQPFGSFERADSGCRCKPLLDLPAIVGVGVTGLLAVGLIFKLAKGREY